MDKKIKKKIDSVQQRLQRFRQQLAGMKKQLDDVNETAALERQIAESEAELAKLKESQR
jgi:type II secretory pathway component PulM